MSKHNPLKKALKIGLLLLPILIITAFFIFDLQQYATLNFIKAQQQALQAYYAQHTLLVMILFGCTYITVTAFSLPAATVLTLLAGALFGLVIGLLIASFASTLGATLAFLIARFLLKDFVQTNYSQQLIKINSGFKREGAFYLFALRLVPAVPFFMINLGMAILPIKPWTFYWISQLGMLPGTAVYVYAGTQLAQIKSLSDITSPSLLFAFALLGVFPLVTKKLLNLIRQGKNHA